MSKNTAISLLSNYPISQMQGFLVITGYNLSLIYNNTPAKSLQEKTEYNVLCEIASIIKSTANLTNFQEFSRHF